MSLRDHLKSAKAAAEEKKYDSLRVICDNGLALDASNTQLLMYKGLACANLGQLCLVW